MARAEPDKVRRVAVVGAGVIGGGWAALLLARGLDVAATDPHPQAEARLRAAVENAWPALRKIGLAPGADPARLTFTPNLEAAVSGAEFVQESAPEDEALKTDVLARIDAAAAPDVVIASSSSGLLPSRIQRDCAHPGRIVIGHPFNPVTILPLVEVLGGERTDSGAIDWVDAFYQTLGKTPLRVRAEVPGYVSDRLQEALWREALHMVADGVATTEEIDAAITGGPGPRWAVMGPCLTFHLAGGEGGMAHALEQFGPALKLPWTRLEAPELTPELSRRMVEGSAAQAAGRTVKALERERDGCLIGILETIANYRAGLGEFAADRYAGYDHRRWRRGAAIEAPLALYDSSVEPAWVDYNRHMSESFYLFAFGDASDALFRYIGIDEDYRAAGKSFYTAESHINYLREASEGEPLTFTTQLLGLDEKRLHLFHTMRHGGDGGALATTEQLLLHVDTTAPRVSPIPPEVLEPLRAIVEAHAALPWPEHAGRRIAVGRGKSAG